MLFTRDRVIEAAARETYSSTLLRKDAATQILREASARVNPADKFDVFLSHARVDEDVVYGTKLLLESHGFSVYVDWIEDPQLNRSLVTRSTASALRRRMKQCRCLLYVYTTNSGTSTWMPWELGYFDGFSDRAAILPVVDHEADEFTGVEYVGIYPYLDEYQSTKGKLELWINEPRSRIVYAPLEEWIEDTAAMRERKPW